MGSQTMKERITAIRERRPLLDQVLRMVEHYGEVKGNIQSGAVTYFAFISFFPLLALGFAVVGFVARVYEGAEADLVAAINTVLPGLVGEGDGEISLSDIRDSAPGILSVGLVVVLYSGLGWLSSMRDALLVMFDLPPADRPSFVIGKLRDLVALATLGVILIVSVAISGVVRGLSADILGWLGLGDDLGWLLGLVAVTVGLAANTLLFWALFRVLAHPELPRRALLSGAILGAIGFELLKQVSQLLLQSTAQSPAFQAFGIALILVVWINYFSRVVMYAAAWAHVHPASRAARPEVAAVVHGPQSPPAGWRDPAATEAAAKGRRSWTGPFAAGSVTTLGLLAALKRRQERPRR